MNPGADVATSPRRCPRCGEAVPTGAEVCPTCEQSLCPECGAAVGDNWSRCIACGARWDLLCPTCEAVVKPGDSVCPRCGAQLDADPAVELSEAVEAAPAPPLAAPPLASPQAVPACSVCGRQDETLRLAAFPYVFSVVVMTFRRAFAGIWCRRHRNRYWALSGLITSIAGWFGIPFGFIYTPITLLRLAKGGVQPAAENKALLETLAAHKLRLGDSEGAIRCSEEVLRLQDDDAARHQLQDLYEQHRPFGDLQERSRAWPHLVAIAVASLAGIAIGAVDSGIAYGVSAQWSGSDNYLVVLLSWLPLVTMLFLCGLGLVLLIEWAMRRGACRQMALGVATALVAALAMAYGALQGTALAAYVHSLASGEFSTGLAKLGFAWLSLSTGGVNVALARAQSGRVSGVVYLVILAVAGVYYVAAGTGGAKATVRWQQALAAVRAGGRPVRAPLLQRGWLVILGVFACLGCSIISIPLWSVLSTAESIGQSQTLIKQGDLDEAVVDLESQVQEDPSSAFLRASLSMLYYGRGEWDKAEDGLLTAIQLNAEWAAPHAMLAGVYYQKGQADLPQQYLLRAEALGREDAFTQAVAGDVYYSMRNFQTARARYERAVELAPRNEAYLLELADAHAAMGECETALQLCEQGAGLGGEPGEAHLCRARAYLCQQDQERASQAASAAVEAAPQDPIAHSALSLVRYLRGDIAGSRRAAEAALELSRYNRQAHYMMALAYLADGEPDPALAAAQEAVRLRPKDDVPHYVLGMCYRAKGDLASAAEEFRTFVNVYWDRPYARPWKAEADTFLATQ